MGQRYIKIYALSCKNILNLLKKGKGWQDGL